MSHTDEYDDSMVTMLELIWGEGYMAPGGPGNVAKLLEGTEPAGKRILDIGCGIGGPAMEMVRRHGATVVGIDLEQPLIDRAQQDSIKAGLSNRCEFRCVQPGPLEFSDASFDIVVSSGAVTQTSDKTALFAEINRVLVAGGVFSCYEWMSNGQSDSPAMKRWIELEGLTYAMATLERYGELLAAAGFEDINLTDASEWYRQKARTEYELLRGDLNGQLVDALGEETAAHFVENWRAMLVVLDRGEMRQGYCRASKK